MRYPIPSYPTKKQPVCLAMRCLRSHRPLHAQKLPGPDRTFEGNVASTSDITYHRTVSGLLWSMWSMAMGYGLWSIWLSMVVQQASPEMDGGHEGGTLACAMERFVVG